MSFLAGRREKLQNSRQGDTVLSKRFLIWDFLFDIVDFEFCVLDFGFGILDLGFETLDLEF